jgi:hypothetical protein
LNAPVLNGRRQHANAAEHGCPDAFLARGWCRFPFDAALAQWAERIGPAARAAVTGPASSDWLRCDGTWFVGVNVLPNDASGALADGAPIVGRAVEFVRRELGLSDFGWDRGQVSVVYPGYPRQMPHESAAAFRYRRERAAAHVDGILVEGPDRRRHLRMYHEFILGIPLAEIDAGRSPLVLWEGSHEIVRQAFREHFGEMPPAEWPDVDVTDLYRSVRRRIFDTCERIEVTARPGESYLLHRLTLHGIVPWTGPASADGRMIVYFRPDTGTPERWLNAP